MQRRWLVSRTNSEYIQYISKAASISPALAQILINRGIKTPGEINDFLNPRLSGLSDPYEFPGMKTSVERIRYAIKAGEKVFVHGDYDADGLTATAIMVHALRMHGLEVHYFIPNRISHGYGFNPASVKIAKKLGASLIITVDCGIASFEAASSAKAEGIDVIITDHHEPRISDQLSVVSFQADDQQLKANNFLLPDVVAVINPKLSTLNSQLSTLSGAGVAFKIVQALDTEFGTDYSLPTLDLAAIGTVADVVPLTGENRIIVREGIGFMQNSRRSGLIALKSAAGLGSREIRSGLLAFTLIPRINAAGRMDDASDVVRLLLSESSEESSELSSWLDRMNSERQKIEEEVYQEALSMVRAEGADAVIVLSGEGWHQGVVGIVASRLAEGFNVPAFILSMQDGIAKGSGRSVPFFDICRGLSECREFLLSFGGHKQAAGLRLKAEDISRFREAMREVIKGALAEEDLTPHISIDADISLSEANHRLVKELGMLEPLGYGNEEPYLGARRLEVVNPRVVGNNHLKMRLKQGRQSIDAIGFDMWSQDTPPVVDAVFTLALNEYNGSSNLQLNIKALRPSR